MLNEETKRKLRLLNLGPVIEIVDQQDSDVQTVGLSFDQRFQQVVDYLFQDKYDEKVNELHTLARNLMQFIAPGAPETGAASAAQTVAPAQAGGASSTVEELKQYKALRDAGVITEEEFAAKKRQLLGI